MNGIKAIVVSTCLLATAGAFAQSDAQRAEQFRQSTDMMIPPAIATSMPERRMQQPAPMESEAQRKTDAFIASTDMMVPPAIAAQMGATPMTKSASAAPMNDNDRRMAEMMQRTDRMKPN